MAGVAFGQKVFTLEEALAVALKQSYSIKTAENTLLNSQKNLEATRLGLMTSVNMEFDLPSYSRSLSSQFNSATGSQQFYQMENKTVEGRLYVTQPLIFSNGTVSIVGSLFGRDQLDAAGSTARDYYSNLSFRLTQPLFTFNNQKANLQKAEINLEKTQRNYSRTKMDIIYNVTASFYDLYQTKKSLEIAEEKVNQTQISYATANNKFKAGLIAEVEALQLEIDLASANNDLLNAKRKFEESKDSFKLLIGLDNSENIDVIAHLEYVPVKINRDKAIELALANRNEIRNAEADIKTGELGLEEVDSKGNVRVDISANYGINKNDDKLNDIFHNFAEDRSVTMTLSVPVWDWGSNKRAVEASRASLELNKLTKQNQIDQIIIEIKQVIGKLESAKERVEALSKSVELAEKSYQISMEKVQIRNNYQL